MTLAKLLEVVPEVLGQGWNCKGVNSFYPIICDMGCPKLSLLWTFLVRWGGVCYTIQLSVYSAALQCPGSLLLKQSVFCGVKDSVWGQKCHSDEKHLDNHILGGGGRKLGFAASIVPFPQSSNSSSKFAKEGLGRKKQKLCGCGDCHRVNPGMRWPSRGRLCCSVFVTTHNLLFTASCRPYLTDILISQS